MAQQAKSKKKQASQQEQQRLAAEKKRKQGQIRRVFTIVICVLVALSLMLPVAGIGAVSCSGTTGGAQGTTGDPANATTP